MTVATSSKDPSFNGDGSASNSQSPNTSSTPLAATTGLPPSTGTSGTLPIVHPDENKSLFRGAVAAISLRGVFVAVALLYITSAYLRKPRSRPWQLSELNKDSNPYDTYKEATGPATHQYARSDVKKRIEELDGDPMFELPGSRLSVTSAGWYSFGRVRSIAVQACSFGRRTIHELPSSGWSSGKETDCLTVATIFINARSKFNFSF